MRKRRYFKTGGYLFLGLGSTLLTISILISYLNNYVPLPWNPTILIGISFYGFIMLTIFGMVLIWYDTSWITPRYRDMAADTPDRDTIARVVTNGDSKDEFLVYGSPYSIVRDVIEKDWPFDEEMKSIHWIVLDEHGTDVSMKVFSNVGGILSVVFD